MFKGSNTVHEAAEFPVINIIPIPSTKNPAFPVLKYIKYALAISFGYPKGVFLQDDKKKGAELVP